MAAGMLTGETGGRQCPYCPRTFAFPSYLQRHLTLHTGEKPFRCHRCNSRFTRRNHLKEHLKRKHTPSQTPSHQLPPSANFLNASPRALSTQHLSSLSNTSSQITLNQIPASSQSVVAYSPASNNTTSTDLASSCNPSNTDFSTTASCSPSPQ
ncbi:early growth response protein 1-like [Procambarus clarkii]|uniref:early growth response protein 1-like n=1 Tax=Procambarus clarkii TaxID=6728 RepID=UPI001E67456C|nr:zinc finger and BTB domain-containing protein 7B-like [Procambarus clarkii]